jgi:hypothetical protein
MDYTTLNKALTDGLTSTASNTIGLAAELIPAAIGVFGIIITIGYAKKLFKKITA